QGGLILTASAVFISTSPPSPSFMAYTAIGPYLLALISFAHALGSILTGSVVILVYENCDRTWAKDVLTADHFRLYAILIFLAWPGLSLGFSIIALMLGKLIDSTLLSFRRLIHVMTSKLFLSPYSLQAWFGYRFLLYLKF
ncbi:hypothetical protein BDN67DRAFT_906919, partial [Paxillus ammoniavirescens]